MRTLRRDGIVAVEIVAALAIASLIVALLDSIAPATGLGVIYLLAVLLVSIRRGEVAGLATAVLSVLVLNFFFIEPRHQLTISDSHNVTALVVFLIAAAVVGRLAAGARARAREAEVRAVELDARRREAALLATTASSLLADDSDWQPPAADAAGARLGLSAAPAPHDGELVVRVPTREESCWLYVDADLWKKADAKRIAVPLADVIDVELSRRRYAETAAEVEAARRAEVAKTALLQAVSHDLRSPLTAITTATGALKSGLLDERDRSELLGVLESEGARLERLIGDLLALSRIEAGAVDPDLDWCDLRDSVATAAEHVRALYGEHPIEISMPDDLPLVKADSVQMQRVFANLIENAAKFSPPGAPVKVDGGGGKHVVITVTDSGHGIPPSQRAHVFEPFFRAGDGAAGSGLGLAICRGFVEANGGRIHLKSHGGPGTSFSVSFPAPKQPA
jgi:two-component system, OmpR family, sensor histidine kinase KdpD